MKIKIRKKLIVTYDQNNHNTAQPLDLHRKQ